MRSRTRMLVVVVASVVLLSACASIEGSGLDEEHGQVAETTTTIADTTTTTIADTTTTTIADTTTTTIADTTTTTIADTTTTTKVPDAAGSAGNDKVLETTAAYLRSQGRQAVLAFAEGGSFMFTEKESGDPLVTYDAATLTQVAVRPDGRIVERVGALLGGPDWPSPYLVDVREYQSLAVRAQAARGGSVVSVDGTESFESTMTLEPEYDEGETDLIGRTVAVGVASGLLTRLVLEYSGDEPRYVSEGGVKEVAKSSGAFAFDVKAGESQDVGFVQLRSVEEAAKTAGYAVPTIGYVPEGFKLISVAYGEAPVSVIGGRRVVALTYQKGGWLVTTTFRPGKFPADPYDPEGDFGFADEATNYAGFTIVNAGITHAYGQIGDTAVTIDGAMSDAEMKKMIDGMT